MKRPEIEHDQTKRVRQDGEGFVLTTWHPQWGGYCSPCEVRFSRFSSDAAGEGMGCFDVTNWHDGEFPTDDPEEVTRYHYCSAEQIVDFGLKVLEAQVGRQVSLKDGSLIPADREWIAETIARLQRLAEAVPSPTRGGT